MLLSLLKKINFLNLYFFHKGSYPRAGSPTLTLLRLHPSNRPDYH